MLRRLTVTQICFCSVPRPPWSNPWEFPPTVPGPLPFPTAGLVPPGILYPSFQAAYEDHAQLSASDYGHWTITSYTLTGDDHPAIAYTIPLILSDGTVYGVLGIEMTTAYLQSLLPFWELQNEQAGSYLLASHTGNLQDPGSRPFCCLLFNRHRNGSL